MQRSSGILLHISSLPSPYGIGSLGKAAYDFVDFLEATGQTYWQVLPLGHTGYGDSPYQAFSMYAGNPYLIDLDMLIEAGLLSKSEVLSFDWGNDKSRVDYAKISSGRMKILRLAYERSRTTRVPELEVQLRLNADWLPDYALFMALKNHYDMRSWLDWDLRAIRIRNPSVLEQYREKLAGDIGFYSFVQALFYSQWSDFREYALKAGIRLIGDIPIYVAADSADVWNNPEYFQLDDELIPKAVAGVPPDYFSADGQLWGNPLYDWDKLKADGYSLWIKRMKAAAKLFDVVRIDHFRGFESYWSVPYGDTTARNGHWIKGPGEDFINVLKINFPELDIIAEDLGYLTEEVIQLVKSSGYPGMKVLQFAFDSREPSDYLPHTYPRHCVCYTGTHDNTTAAGWFAEINKDDAAYAKAYLGLNVEEGPVWGLIRGGMSSVADLFVAQMQDYLELPGDCRMNTPGTMSGNWQWRMLADECTDKLAKKIHAMTKLYGR